MGLCSSSGYEYTVTRRVVVVHKYFIALLFIGYMQNIAILFETGYCFLYSFQLTMSAKFLLIMKFVCQ